MYSDILRDIAAGTYGGGARLPSEVEFSVQFGVSRPIVREALGRLREEGVIWSKKGSGSYVVPLRLAGNGGEAKVKRQIASISDVQKLYQFRYSLEGEIALLASQNRTGEQITVIDRAADELARSARDAFDGIDEDLRFHRSIAEATNNPFFVAALDRILVDMRFIVELARTLLMRQSEKNIEAVQREHSVIRDAIRAGDGAAAREHMQFHIRTAQARLFFGDARESAGIWPETPPT